MDYPIITLDEALTQGTTPAALFSIARFQRTLGNQDNARRLRQLAFDVARANGKPIRKRAHNDNGKASKRRAA